MKIDAFLGVDAGATSLRAAVIDASGAALAVRRGPGIGSFGPGGGRALTVALHRTLSATLEASGSVEVRTIVIGLAGSATRTRGRVAVRQVTASLGLEQRPLVVHDAETTFATGTSSPDGYVLAAGSGAIAMAINDHRAGARVDGHGWLLGDQGSAVWIGLGAVRAVLSELDGRSERTSLTDELPEFLASLADRPPSSDPSSIVGAAHRLPPVALGRLAPIVDRHAADGDPVARRLLEAAAKALETTLAATIEQAERPPDMPIVLGGSVIARNAIIRHSLERAVARRWPSARLRIVANGTAGAALWARRLGGHGHDERRLDALRDEIETTAIDLHA